MVRRFASLRPIRRRTCRSEEIRGFKTLISILGEQIAEVVGGQRFHHGGVGRVDGRGDDRLLAALEREDLLLDRARGDHLHDVDGLLLPDAVRAVRRLILHRRIPPRIVVHHHVRAREIEARTARHERDEEDRGLRVAVEAVAFAEAVLRRSVEVATGDMGRA